MALVRRATPLALLVLLAVGVPAHGQESLRDAAERLRAAVRAEEARIAATREGLADAERRLAVLNARLSKRRAQLDDAHTRLVRARVRLSRLERKQREAEELLAENLRETYKSGQPTFITVVLHANGFSDLISQFEFYRRVARRNASVLNDTRKLRREVFGQAVTLKRMRARYAELAREAEKDRNAADAIRTALLRREAAQLRRRAGVAARLASVQNRLAAIRRRQEEAARRARAARTAARAAPAPVPNARGGDVVARVVAAANEIARTPYVYGGGHGGNSGGYDCSGSISYALAAAGLLDSPLDSTGFMSWGEPGPGRRITVYANAGHAFMVVDGRRYDTSALSGGGTRWSNSMRSTAGFVARHPPGL